MAQDLRPLLHSAFAYVRSGEANKATSNLTLDHLILEQILFLKKGETRSIVAGTGDTVGMRISRYDQLDTLLEKIHSLIDEVRSAGTDEQKLAEVGVEMGVDL